ncbi:SDR family NAD(P)-dependent oxidoreductase [Corynebacterium hylobatis]|uniref:SDR family NAD(P)-dependent oxidoreductase n=1 Tax=Corynebacterium hylobatis TaxID=1859290 RepID=A0A3S0HFP0_9CORY|nr:sugar nucleotide-binding protein [Corynebacterium hylobatis]RSZ61643.1 SDR family NAD(P)-dependent oxidoreductase [Corynebacterium hylobatis]
MGHSEAADQPARVMLVGCGRVGTRLGRRLLAAGREVVALRRDTSSLPAEFTGIAVDLTEPPGRELPAADAMVITLTPSMGGDPDGYLVALRNLAAALPSVPPRVIFVSSTGVFEGRYAGRPLTEADVPAPTTPRGILLRGGELLATELFDALIIRPAGIYGPGREMILRKVLERSPIRHAQRTNRIHEVDLVRTLEWLLTAGDPPRVLHAVDRAPAPLGEVAGFVAQHLGLPAPPEATSGEAGGTVLDGSLLHGLLGGLRYPTFREGYAEIIADR